MGYNAVFPATVTTGSTVSSEINVGEGWQAMYLVVPSLTSNSQVHIQGADVTGGTFRRIVQKDAASALATVDFAIGSATTNRIIPIPVTGLRFLKVETTAIMSSAALFQIICAKGE